MGLPPADLTNASKLQIAAVLLYLSEEPSTEVIMKKPPRRLTSRKSVARTLSLRKSRVVTKKDGEGPLRHPVTLMLLGFALTAGVGGWIQDRQQAAERDRADVVAAWEAENRVVVAFSEFDILSNMYAERRHTADEERLRQELDKAFINTKIAIRTAYLPMRRPFGIAEEFDDYPNPSVALYIFDHAFELAEKTVMDLAGNKKKLRSYLRNLFICHSQMYGFVSKAIIRPVAERRSSFPSDEFKEYTDREERNDAEPGLPNYVAAKCYLYTNEEDILWNPWKK